MNRSNPLTKLECARVLELMDSRAFERSENSLQVIAPATTVGHLDDGTGVVTIERGSLEKWCLIRGLNPIYMAIIRPGP